MFEDGKNNYIHLSDGGQSGDNLGIISLLRRNVENIIIFDGAQDKGKNDLSYLNELCAANNYLEDKGYTIIFDGNPTEENSIEPFKLSEECDKGHSFNLSEGLSSYRWKKPVWRGQIERSLALQTLSENNFETHKFGKNLFYIKSALSQKAWKKFSGQQLENNQKSPGFICKSNKENVNFYCPLAWYFNGSENDPNFPQDSTITTTYNGNAKRFKAYRDLGWFLAGKLMQEKDLLEILKH